MPAMRVAGRDQMGHPQWYTEVKMQELQVAVFVPPEGHLEIQPVSMVQEMGVRKDDDRGDISFQRIQQQAASPVIR